MTQGVHPRRRLFEGGHGAGGAAAIGRPPRLSRALPAGAQVRPYPLVPSVIRCAGALAGCRVSKACALAGEPPRDLSPSWPRRNAKHDQLCVLNSTRASSSSSLPCHRPLTCKPIPRTLAGLLEPRLARIPVAWHQSMLRTCATSQARRSFLPFASQRQKTDNGAAWRIIAPEPAETLM